MTFVEVYGDIHNDEDRAKEIQEMVRNQGPDALFYECELDNEEISYLMSSLTSFSTFGDVFKVFEVEKSDGSFNKEGLKAPIYKFDSEEIKKYLEEILKLEGVSGGTESQRALKDPHQMLLSSKKDKALYSLTYNLNCHLADDKSSILPRLSVLVRLQSFSVHTIDGNRDYMWKYGAKRVSRLPNDPRKVKKLYKQFRNKNTSEKRSKKEKIIEKSLVKLINKFDGARENLMAAQVDGTIKDNSYENCAVIVGRKHEDKVTEVLRKSYQVEEEDEEGLIESLF